MVLTVFLRVAEMRSADEHRGHEVHFSFLSSARPFSRYDSVSRGNYESHVSVVLARGGEASFGISEYERQRR